MHNVQQQLHNTMVVMLPKNYRHVALTSHLIKLLEKILAKNIHQFLETHQKMNPKQHGFRSGRSCTLIDNIFYNRVDEIESTGVITTNISDHYPIFSKELRPIMCGQCINY